MGVGVGVGSGVGVSVGTVVGVSGADDGDKTIPLAPPQASKRKLRTITISILLLTLPPPFLYFSISIINQKFSFCQVFKNYLKIRGRFS
jgi:hypothetical protein